MTARQAYEDLLRRTNELALLASMAELFDWDELTNMPRNGVANRGSQMAYLAGLQHEKTTDPRLGDLLATLEGSEVARDPLSDAAVNVREMRRAYNRATKVSRALVEELARIASFAQQQWNVARQDADFAAFQPCLEQMIALKREQAQALDSHQTLYDALLDDYEPGATSAEIARLFAGLRAELQPLLQALGGVRKKPSRAVLHRDYPVERQRSFGEAVAAALGFDFEGGRLDTTPHPFFGSIGRGDVRITTRFSPNHFSDGFFGILHEVGHGLYEQGLDPAHDGTPLGNAPSVGLHESQARLWENLVGRGRGFWEYHFPQARQAFPSALRGVTLDRFYAAVNAVEPGSNRVQADEVTYNLHIFIRFDIEQALIAGALKAADVPAAWNEAYQKALGITPANDAEGCLQDGHWSAGLIGYFPTYTLGNILAAQLFAQAAREIGDLDKAIAHGDFSGLLGWLRDKVYRSGCRYRAAKLVEHITGAPPDHGPLVAYLRRKYGELYGL
jgi:carboxypeptidase Taq